MNELNTLTLVHVYAVRRTVLRPRAGHAPVRSCALRYEGAVFEGSLLIVSGARSQKESAVGTCTRRPRAREQQGNGR